MARYTGPTTRISRRFGTFLGSGKAFERRSYPPGVHGPKMRRKLSEYAVGLNEKQKLRYIYGLLERQFRRVFEIAKRERGVTGERFLQLLGDASRQHGLSARSRQEPRGRPPVRQSRSYPRQRPQGRHRQLQRAARRRDRGQEHPKRPVSSARAASRRTAFATSPAGSR
jgi:hypothetical protein